MTVLRDLRCGPKLGVLVDLVEPDGVGVTFKTVETLRGAFFFSVSIIIIIIY